MKFGYQPGGFGGSRVEGNLLINNGFLGINVDIPEFLIDAYRETTARFMLSGASDVEVIVATYNNNAGEDSDLELWRARGTKEIPAIIEDGDAISSIKSRAFNDGAETFGFSTATEIASEVDGGTWVTAPGGRLVFRVRKKNSVFGSEFEILKLLSNDTIVIPTGSLGIGKNPSELLHLYSGINSTDIGLEGGVSSGTGWRLRNDQAANRLTISSVTGSFDTFAERFTILANGNIGINKIAPSEKLDINGNINIAVGSVLKVNAIQVITSQQAAIVDASVSTTETADATYSSNEQSMLNNLKADVTDLKNQLNAALAMLRTHGLIAA